MNATAMELKTTLLRLKATAETEKYSNFAVMKDANELASRALELIEQQDAADTRERSAEGRSDLAELVAEASRALLERGIRHVILLPQDPEPPALDAAATQTARDLATLNGEDD